MWKFSVERWKAIREMRGLSEAEMARELGINRQNVNNYETGNNLPTVPTILKYIQVNNVSSGPGYFFIQEANNDLR